MFPAFLANLSTPVKGVLALGTVGGLVAVAFVTGDDLWSRGVILLVGLVVVALILLAYVLLLKVFKRRRGSRFVDDLNQAGKPAGVNNPEEIARLDDLRKTFQGGLEQFRAAGKDLYSLPWYLIIGESGAGKTEAIRRCGVGFPPGLQDELQGVGGTVNMNWWFTNNAVILDTAGKMVFPELDSSAQTQEWEVFLNLLKRNRKHCPINGLILVIPADGFFITETDRREGLDLDQKIQKKSSEIARQLELIKQRLEVRFPVYLVITKADLIVGFREFFDSIDDPNLQQQVMMMNQLMTFDKIEHNVDIAADRFELPDNIKALAANAEGSPKTE